MSGIHGFMKMDLVAHCGRHISGTFLWTPSLTDIASGWTECVALLARNAELIIRTVDKVQKVYHSNFSALMLITESNLSTKLCLNTVLPGVSR
ncbi:hypothetical protein [Enterobacter asburiae]|uniref:hypothetical protein n=1 Tax=Enterobacter asburiae TaxID=61645 RepID=UPI003BE872FC